MRSLIFRRHFHFYGCAWMLSGMLSGMLLALQVEGCHEQNDGTVAPTINEMKEMNIIGIEGVDGDVVLSSGRWEGKASGPDATVRPVVRLVEDILLQADVTGDGSDDALVFVTSSVGESSSFISMHLIERDGRTLQNTATVPLGDRVQIRDVSMDSGAIVLNLVQHSADDPGCCPGDVATRKWVWEDGDLIERNTDIIGRLGPEVLKGTVWRLVVWNSMEMVPDSVTITITFVNDELAGTAGCNRYFASVTQSGIPGDIDIGHVGSTRMSCPEPLMEAEGRYLAILPHVNQFGFLYGRLFFGYTEDGRSRVMVFEKQKV